MKVKDQRSGIYSGNIQEILDATNQKKVSARFTGQQQYSTPPLWAELFYDQLTNRSPVSVLDPQCAGGNLLDDISTYNGDGRFGVEIDKRFKDVDSIRINRITGNWVRVANLLVRHYPEIKFECQVANPPFGIKWKVNKNETMDSTEFTWMMMLLLATENGCGYIISNQKTIERLGIHQHEWSYLYQIIPPGMWKNVDVKIGVVHFQRTKKNGKPQELTKIELDRCDVEMYRDAWHSNPPKARSFFTISECLPDDIHACWREIKKILKEGKPKFNVSLGRNGRLKIYLSVLERKERKISGEEINRLLKIEGAHPLALTVEVETRRTLQSLIEDKIYRISPEAKQSIESALSQVKRAIVPIMPTTDFESVGYVDEMETLKCINSNVVHEPRMKLTKGKRYVLSSGTYTFTEHFERKKQHDSKEKGVHFLTHHCSLTGQDRYIEITDDNGIRWRFKERPNAIEDEELSKYSAYDVSDKHLWKIFEKPHIKTIKEEFPDLYRESRQKLDLIMENARQDGHDFKYYEGQIDYLCRAGIKGRGLIAADVGCGKTLMALTLLQMRQGIGSKFSGRALIVAPQGTVKSQEKESVETNDTLAQWVTEIRRFAPGIAVHRINSHEDYWQSLDENGELPDGIYLTYYEAMFRNGSIEKTTKSKSHEVLCKQYGLEPGEKQKCYHLIETEGDFLARKLYQSRSKKKKCSGSLERLKRDLAHDKLPPDFERLPEMKVGEVSGSWELEEITKEFDPDVTQGVGDDSDLGITCVIEPCLATKICAKHNNPFETVVLDEVQVMTNLKAQITKRIIRIQSKYRYALSATPIPNIVSNLFSIMGWLCVDDWYRGDKRNARWPFARDEQSRFDEAFLSRERDHTQEDLSKSPGKCLKVSPVISSPTRLLKIIKPTLSFVSKEMCNDEYQDAKVIDVRVPLGDQQRKRYEHFLNIRNVPTGKRLNPFFRAGQQVIILRNIAADPRVKVKGESNSPKVLSEFNPKLIACMELCKTIFERGEQVLIVSARIEQTNAIERCLNQSIGDEYISRIDSTTGARCAAKESFRFKTGKTRVMLMGIKCAAGHSFSHCPNEIVMSIEFSYGPFHQAKGRIDRVNSEKRANIYVVLHKDSIEESMFDRCAQKQDAATICLRGERVPRDFVPVSVAEVLASHIDDYKYRSNKIIEKTNEIELELRWDELRGEVAQAFASGLPKLIDTPSDDLDDDLGWLDDFDIVDKKLVHKSVAIVPEPRTEIVIEPVEEKEPAEPLYVVKPGTDILEFNF